MRPALLALAVLLTACSTAPSYPETVRMDHAYWEPAENTARDIRLHIVSFKRLQELAVAGGHPLRSGDAIHVYRGLAQFNTRPCQIWLTPKTFNTGALQHEVRHCFVGHFHD